MPVWVKSEIAEHGPLKRLTFQGATPWTGTNRAWFTRNSRRDRLKPGQPWECNSPRADQFLPGMTEPNEWQHKDKYGTVMPWYTAPMLEVLQTFPMKDWRVFEYGCGFSTIWYGLNCREVVSVEHNEEFVQELRKLAPGNVAIKHCTEPADYVAAINVGEKFDLIVVDGVFREMCAKPAFDRIKPGGIVILDNSERPEILKPFLEVFKWNERHSYPMPRHPDWSTDYWRVTQFERWDGLLAETAARLERERRARAGS